MKEGTGCIGGRANVRGTRAGTYSSDGGMIVGERISGKTRIDDVKGHEARSPLISSLLLLTAHSYLFYFSTPPLGLGAASRLARAICTCEFVLRRPDLGRRLQLGNVIASPYKLRCDVL